MIAIYVDNFDRATFFYRLAKGGVSEKYVFFTTKYSVYRYLKCEFDVLLFNNISTASIENYQLDNDDFINLTYVRRGSQSLIQAKNVYCSIRETLSTLETKYSEVHLAIVFNGNSASQKAFIDHFKQYDTATLYCEISNLPGKVIFDRLGVNAKSSLFFDSSPLDNSPNIDITEHTLWITLYEEYKNKSIPQGKLELRFIKAYITDYLSSLLGKGIREEDEISLIKKVLSVIKLFKTKTSSNLIYDSVELSNDYVFFPTQVRYDSQLILNSDVDNLQAIEIAASLAKEKKHKLYVKIHPAETDIEILKKYQELKTKLGFFIVNENTTKLIKEAQIVVTINSTVGLEALIYNKELKVLGRALYSNFDFSRVVSYIHNYLINFDYFSDELITEKEFKKILKLAEK